MVLLLLVVLLVLLVQDDLVRFGFGVDSTKEDSFWETFFLVLEGEEEVTLLVVMLLVLLEGFFPLILEELELTLFVEWCFFFFRLTFFFFFCVPSA